MLYNNNKINQIKFTNIENFFEQFVKSQLIIYEKEKLIKNKRITFDFSDLSYYIGFFIISSAALGIFLYLETKLNPTEVFKSTITTTTIGACFIILLILLFGKICVILLNPMEYDEVTTLTKKEYFKSKEKKLIKIVEDKFKTKSLPIEYLEKDIDNLFCGIKTNTKEQITFFSKIEKDLIENKEII